MFQKKMANENKNVLLLLNNFQGHKISFETYPNVHELFLRPNVTGFLQPQDQTFYANVKAKYTKFRRSYCLENDCYPTEKIIYEKVTNILLSLDSEFVKCCWKMAGLSPMTHSDEELAQVLYSTFILK